MVYWWYRSGSGWIGRLVAIILTVVLVVVDPVSHHPWDEMTHQYCFVCPWRVSSICLPVSSDIIWLYIYLLFIFMFFLSNTTQHNSHPWTALASILFFLFFFFSLSIPEDDHVLLFGSIGRWWLMTVDQPNNPTWIHFVISAHLPWASSSIMGSMGRMFYFNPVMVAGEA